MEYRNERTGQLSNVPWSKDEAVANGYFRFMTESKCESCGADPCGRYVENDQCVQCATKDLKYTWNLWLMGSPDRPDPFPRNKDQAIQMGVSYYWREIPCKNGPHFVQPDIKTGKCRVCNNIKNSPETILMRENPDMILDKHSAELLDLSVFRTGHPCKHGHKAWRYVSSGACVECVRGLRIHTKIEPVTELQHIRIDEQLVMFIGYAWDGRKMIDPNGKKWNRLQFSSMFPGPAAYQLKNGKTSAYAFDAFISNFTCKR